VDQQDVETARKVIEPVKRGHIFAFCNSETGSHLCILQLSGGGAGVQVDQQDAETARKVIAGGNGSAYARLKSR